MRVAERLGSVLEQGGRTVYVKVPFAAPGNSEVLQDLGLQRGTETLRPLDAVVLRRCLELGERGDAEILVKP